MTYEHDNPELGPKFEDISVENDVITVGGNIKIIIKKGNQYHMDTKWFYVLAF